jgi:uncharacterized membrane protein YagU involved in acid resistance
MSILHNQTERRGTVTMSTVTSTSHIHSHSLLRFIVLGGVIIGITHSIIHHWFVSSILGGYPLITVLQYMASGALGNAAFEGGIGTALLGLLFHFIVSFVVAAVFVLSADRIPLLRRYPIPGALAYGFGVLIVMNLIVLPLSAAPPLPAPTTPQLIELILEHVLVIGLTLGIIVRRNAEELPHSRKEQMQWQSR